MSQIKGARGVRGAGSKAGAAAMEKSGDFARRAAAAMTAAAWGDALGWPQERRRSAGVCVPGIVAPAWERKCGGRYFPHYDLIGAGQYSDDTQLMLCVGRALLHGDSWTEYLRRVELPLWTLYERGGGKAVKKAAQLWLAYRAPWDERCRQSDVADYFGAGGNGAAMRILPHVIALADRDFSDLARHILSDGISTHAHPAAMVGALAWGYALWSAVRLSSDERAALTPTGPVQQLLDNKATWAAAPDLSALPAAWTDAMRTCHNNWEQLWQENVDFMVSELDLVRAALSAPQRPAITEIMESLHSFDRSCSGSGIVAAATALMLACAHLDQPLEGVKAAAFALGSDTDTCASMTASVLALLSDGTWVDSIRDQVQDAGCIEQLATSLCNKVTLDSALPVIKASALKKWHSCAMQSHEGQIMELPDLRCATIHVEEDFLAPCGNFKVARRTFAVNDGQTLFIKKISKTRKKEQD